MTFLVTHKQLLYQLLYQEIVGRYKGTYFGMLWSFLLPLFMLTVYVFVFSVVFKARWSGGSDDKFEFAIILFCGLIIYNLFADIINRSPSLIVSNPNYVKKVVFPLKLLPFVLTGGALFHALVSFSILIVVSAFYFGTFSATILFLPFIISPFLLLIVGLSLFLAAIGVYIRDINQGISIITTAMLFLSPVFFSTASLPEALQPYLYLNPNTLIIEQARNVLLWNKTPDWSLLAMYTIVSIGVFFLGYVFFAKTQKGFSDVL